MRAFIGMIVLLCVVTATAEAHEKKSEDASFGDTVTTNIKLTGDISGSGTGLTIGAERMTIDLNGHTISFTGGTGIGIDNPGGYDDAEIKDCKEKNGDDLGLGAGAPQAFALASSRSE